MNDIIFSTSKCPPLERLDESRRGGSCRVITDMSSPHKAVVAFDHICMWPRLPTRQTINAWHWYHMLITWLAYQRAEGMEEESRKKAAKPVTTLWACVSTFRSVKPLDNFWQGDTAGLGLRDGVPKRQFLEEMGMRLKNQLFLQLFWHYNFH